MRALEKLACLFTMALAIFLFSPEIFAATSPTNATVRVPRTIRVALTGGGVEYVTFETYVARVLNHEWFSSWGNYAGGMNSLKAGTVAIRSYAINRLNNVSASV